MDKLISEIEEYAKARGIKPATVLQYGANLSGSTWAKWLEGRATCTMQVAEKLREYMADNPADVLTPDKDAVA